MAKLTKDYNFAALYPKISREWHPTMNGDLQPNEVFPKSNKKVWWICSKGHEWEARISNRTNLKRGCPYCSTPPQKIGYGNDLKSNYPKIAKEWHPTMNGDLEPSKVFPTSNKKVWWACSKGHEWDALISNRVNLNRGCPYCTNQKVGYGNDLESNFPELLKEWNYIKNNINPKKIVYGTPKKVWWICKYGHEWKASVVSRTGKNKSGCPRCTRQTSELEIFLYAELSTIFKKVHMRMKIEGMEVDIFLEEQNIGIEVDGSYWHREKLSKDKLKSKKLKDKGVSLIRVREKPLKKIYQTDIVIDQKWSRIDKLKVSKLLIKSIAQFLQKNSHEMQKVKDYLKVLEPVNEKYFKKIISELPNPIGSKNLENLYPLLANEWHPTKNGKLKPSNFSYGSEKKAWWLCPKGHEFEMKIHKRVKGRNCTYCSGYFITKETSFSGRFPNLIKEWHPIKNQGLNPEKIRVSSLKKVWWICSKGHEWEARIKDRARVGKRSSGCHVCWRAKVNKNLKHVK